MLDHGLVVESQLLQSESSIVATIHLAAYAGVDVLDSSAAHIK